MIQSCFYTYERACILKGKIIWFDNITGLDKQEMLYTPHKRKNRSYTKKVVIQDFKEYVFTNIETVIGDLFKYGVIWTNRHSVIEKMIKCEQFDFDKIDNLSSIRSTNDLITSLLDEQRLIIPDLNLKQTHIQNSLILFLQGCSGELFSSKNCEWFRYL